VNGTQTLGPARLLFGDTIIGFLLLNEARHRVIAWVYGMPREDSNQMTAVAIGSLAGGLHTGARLLGSRAVPSVAATAIGAAALKETVNGIAGPASRTTPAFGALVAFALLGTSFGPALRGSGRGVRRAFHDVGAGSRMLREFLGGGR
jgi:hypothetical protein